ncbi:hypothetical protein Cadr_000027558 [Camelus dromedarius]|uniref:Uncharacterized protein n=1 Tax=Camelus dromedarius TaxID=9838 RepID=A0A5N4CBG1_CAMDR|nr:hypothetical protein Cadr_000027558 [Camelus dromedarius]
MGGLGRGTGTLRQEVLYPEKQILHDWTATFVLYCLCLCVCVCVCVCVPPTPSRSFTFLPTLSPPSSPLLLFFVLGRGEKMWAEVLDETKQNKTKQKIPVYFVLDETKPNRRYLYVKVKMTDGHFKEILSDALLELTTWNFVFFL